MQCRKDFMLRAAFRWIVFGKQTQILKLLNIGRPPLGLQKWFNPSAQQAKKT